MSLSARETATMKLRICCLAAILLGGPALGTAQEWHGTLGLGWAGLNTSGSQDGFKTQINLDEGFFLDDLSLTWGSPSGTQLIVEGSGWGDAEPTSSASVRIEGAGAWRIGLNYDRRESFFALASTDLGARRDEWQITRWRGWARWEGWSFATLSLDLERTERGGTLERPYYGLNELYPVGADLDESRSSASLRLVTKSLPVHLELEQSFASYSRRNRLHPAGTSAINGDDPDLLDDVATDFSDDQDVPTTRLAASWSNQNVEVAASALWSSTDLDRTGAGWNRFLLGGGDIGSVEFVDTISSSASTDTLAGNLRIRAALGRGWRLTLTGSSNDTQTDTALLGDRLLRIANPLGESVELPASLNESGILERTDTAVRLTLEHRLDRWLYWFGGSARSRDVTWQRETDAPVTDVSRDTTGALFGIGYRPGGGVWVSAEYEYGDFDRFVFRTDPATVNRLTVKARAPLGSGFSGSLYSRIERADNPAEQAGLSHRATAVGASTEWADSQGQRSLGLDVSLDSVTTDTALLLPDGQPGDSRYDLGLLTVTAYGAAKVGKLDLRASATRISDSGDTWPADSWNLAFRASIEVWRSTRLAGFLQYWKYDEERASIDDFTATRFGAVLTWSF